MAWSLRKKKECIFCNVYFVRKKFFKHLCFISMYSELNKLSVYTFTYQKHCFIHFCYLFLESLKAFVVSLTYQTKSSNDRVIAYYNAVIAFLLHLVQNGWKEECTEIDTTLKELASRNSVDKKAHMQKN